MESSGALTIIYGGLDQEADTMEFSSNKLELCNDIDEGQMIVQITQYDDEQLHKTANGGGYILKADAIFPTENVHQVPCQIHFPLFTIIPQNELETIPGDDAYHLPAHHVTFTENGESLAKDLAGGNCLGKVEEFSFADS